MKVAAPGTIYSGITEVLSEFAQRAKAAWARLIRKVYEPDPLECPKCEGPMRRNRADRGSRRGASDSHASGPLAAEGGGACSAHASRGLARACEPAAYVSPRTRHCLKARPLVFFASICRALFLCARMAHQLIVRETA